MASESMRVSADLKNRDLLDIVKDPPDRLHVGVDNDLSVVFHGGAPF